MPSRSRLRCLWFLAVAFGQDPTQRPGIPALRSLGILALPLPLD